MKKIKIIIASFTMALLLASCTSNTLQGYLVKSQEKSGFITFDIPASILQLKSDDVDEETKKALNSLKKVNLVAFPFNDNASEIEKERKEIEGILTNSKYKSLMRFTESKIKISIYYSGTGDAIDEVIAYGYAADKGVGIARILGENINPSKIVKMMKDVKLDGDGMKLESIQAIFSGK